MTNHYFLSLLAGCLLLVPTGLKAQKSATEVPVIKINIDGGNMVTDKENYLKAWFVIDGKGQYDNLSDSVEIRGRGNSSWSTPSMPGFDPKNPYKLKFKKKQAPFGLTKGKKWVLLANKINGSLLTNAIGMKVAKVVGTEGANDIIPVELYINDEYRGNYNFTEQVDISANSIKLANEVKATLIELDTYYDETYKFKDSSYGLPANIKFPDFVEDNTVLTQADIETSLNQLTAAIAAGKDLASQLDLEALAKYMLVNELICNQEIHHPKSTYLYNANVTDPTSKWKFGPVWDFDWAYGYDVNRNYATIESSFDFWNPTNNKFEQTKFWNVLLSHKEVKKAYYKVWKQFMENGLQQVLDYCDSYYEWNASSLASNADKWGDDTDYKAQAARMKQWLKDRAESIYNGLEKFDDQETGINTANTEKGSYVDVADLNGRVVKRHADPVHWKDGLPAGVYVVSGKVVVVK